MKLDTRIKSLSDIITCFDEDKDRAVTFVGQKGYFADDMMEFGNLGSCTHGKLEDYGIDNNYPFKCEEDDIDHAFFIPESVLKPKPKYRPFTMEEFNNLVEFGEFVSYRQKDKAHTYCVMYVGNQYTSETEANPQEDMVGLGPYYHSFEELLTDYEWLPADQDKWVPFGVEVTE